MTPSEPPRAPTCHLTAVRDAASPAGATSGLPFDNVLDLRVADADTFRICFSNDADAPRAARVQVAVRDLEASPEVLRCRDELPAGAFVTIAARDRRCYQLSIGKALAVGRPMCDGCAYVLTAQVVERDGDRLRRVAVRQATIRAESPPGRPSRVIIAGPIRR